MQTGHSTHDLYMRRREMVADELECCKRHNIISVVDVIDRSFETGELGKSLVSPSSNLSPCCELSTGSYEGFSDWGGEIKSGPFFHNCGPF